MGPEEARVGTSVRNAVGRPLLALTSAILTLVAGRSEAAALAIDTQEVRQVVNTAAQVREAPSLRPDEVVPVADLQEIRMLSLISLDGRGRLYAYEAGAVTVADDGSQQRIGEGLAELALQIAAARDTVLLLDQFREPGARLPTLRVHVLGPDGTRLATVPYAGKDPGLLTGTDAGWVAVQRRWMPEEAEAGGDGAAADTLEVVQWSPDTGQSRVLFGYPSGRARLLRSGARTSPPPDGVRGLMIAADGRIYTHPGTRHVIDVRTLDGVLEKRITTETEAWSPGGMLASRDGHLLVEREPQEESASPDGERWDLFDPEGRIVGVLPVEDGQTLLAFEWPHVYASVPDGSDADRVVRFRLSGSD